MFASLCDLFRAGFDWYTNTTDNKHSYEKWAKDLQHLPRDMK